MADVNICVICGTTKGLIKHHICYHPEVTEIVCKKCHPQMHHNFRIKKIQKLNRIAIPNNLFDDLNWKISDYVLLEVYKDKLIVENLNDAIRPFEERYRYSPSGEHSKGS